MLTALTDIYDILRRQFGDEDAKRVIDFFQQNIARIATKDDLAQLERRLTIELVHKADKEDVTRLEAELQRKADKEDITRLEAEINRRALQETVTRIEEELKRKADKEDVARLEAELQRKADKEDIVQLREVILRFEMRLNLYFVVLLLLILLTNPKVWELLSRLLPFVR